MSIYFTTFFETVILCHRFFISGCFERRFCLLVQIISSYFSPFPLCTFLCCWNFVALIITFRHLEDSLDDWLNEELDNYLDDDYLVFDCPGIHACLSSCVYFIFIFIYLYCIGIQILQLWKFCDREVIMLYTMQSQEYVRPQKQNWDHNATNAYILICPFRTKQLHCQYFGIVLKLSF